MPRSEGKWKSRRPCSWPGCDQPSYYAGFRCSRHRQWPEIPGYRDRYCKWCGYGPLSRLDGHTRTLHGGVEGTAEYRRQFGIEGLFSRDFLAAKGDIWKDRIEDGIVVLWRRRITLCPEGHRLTKRGNQKSCRKCRNAKDRAKRWENRPAWKRQKRKCEWCGKAYNPVNWGQRFCGPEHSRLGKNANERRRRRASAAT